MKYCTFILFFILATGAFAQDSLSVVKRSKNLVTMEISDAYFPFLYITDSVVLRKTLGDIAVKHNTGWTGADIKKIALAAPFRASVDYINKTILGGRTTQTYQPYARTYVMYDFLESAYRNAALRAPDLQRADRNKDLPASDFQPWVLVILDLSTGYTEKEVRAELKKRNITRVFFDIRGNALPILPIDGADDPVAPPPPPPHPANGQKDVYNLVDEQAQFPGGAQQLQQFIAKNLSYPQSAKDNGVQGKVWVKFVVSEKGDISGITIARKLNGCPECEAEAISVVKMMPKWIPAKIKGKAVSSFYNLPIVFAAN